MPGQLSLFGGARQRGRRPPPAPERATHIALADLLRVGLKHDEWLWFHPANGELRDKNTAALLQRMGVTPGVSDFVFCGPEGRFYALELKRRGKRPTPSQTSFLARVRALGGVSAWADSFDGAVEILKGWEAIRVTLPGLPAERRLVPYAGKEE